MAAHVPQSGEIRATSSSESLNVHQPRWIIWMALTMSAIGLIDLDLPSVQAQQDTEPAPTPALFPESENSSALAETKQTKILELELIKEEESVSIAIRHEQPISKSPSNVYVVTDEDIRTSGAKDLPTVLRRIPGIEVIQMTGADFNVSARGDNQLRQNKMLVMVDGRSIYLDAQGEVLWKMIPVTLPEIKRIEVLKGPASVVYGFNAFDGVINIITKSPDEMKGTTVQFGGGEFGSLTSAAVYANRHDKLGYRLSIGHDQNNKWSDRNSLAFRSNKFNVQTEYSVTPSSRFTVAGGLVDSNNYDGPIVDTVAVNQKPAIGYANVGFEAPTFFIRGWWQHLAQPFTLTANPLLRNILTIIPQDNRMEGNTYNLEAQKAFELTSQHRLTFGANYRHNSFLNNRFNSGIGREDRFGLYLQEEWNAAQWLTVIVGVRYDLDTFINPTISPRAAILFSPWENHTFRLSGSVGYRPPTITENQDRSLATLFGFPGFNLGNVNLVPEQIISYELGYQGWYLKHRLRVRADLFFNHISDLIGTRAAGTNAIYNNGGNLPTGNGEADIYGGEAGIEFWATSWLSGFANYSYQEIGQTFRGGLSRGAPRFKANAGLRTEFDNGLSGEALVHYVGAATYGLNSSFQIFAPFLAGGQPPPDPRVGSYVLLNLRGAYRVWREKSTGREAEVAVTAFNALNDRHKEHPLGETIGSLVMGWLTVKY